MGDGVSERAEPKEEREAADAGLRPAELDVECAVAGEPDGVELAEVVGGGGVVLIQHELVLQLLYALKRLICRVLICVSHFYRFTYGLVLF